MRKSLALLAVATLMLGTTGCGCCRGLFGKSNPTAATPLYSQCAPTCSPGASCGCQTGTPVTYGFDGDAGAPVSSGATYESTLAVFSVEFENGFSFSQVDGAFHGSNSS